MARTGRPSKYDTLNKAQLEQLYLAGWDDAQVSKFFGVTEATFTNWKSTHKEFFSSLKEWKKIADEKVERSLYERACGYSHKAVKMFVIAGKVVTEEYIEHYPPSEVACIFWLKNRQPEQWRDKQEIEHSVNFTLAERVKEARERVIQSKPSVN